MIEKPTIYVDFDNTIFNTIAIMCEYGNKKFNKDYKYTDMKSWNAKDLYPNMTKKDLHIIFTEYMWQSKFNKDYIFDNCIETLTNQRKNYNICLTSIGVSENIAQKTKFMNKYLKDVIDNWIFLGSRTIHMDKSIITDSNSIIIDDHYDALHSANVPYKICANMCEGEWNIGWTGTKCNNWNEINDILNAISISAKAQYGN